MSHVARFLALKTLLRPPGSLRAPMVALAAASAVLAATVIFHAREWSVAAPPPAQRPGRTAGQTPVRAIGIQALRQMPGWHLFGTPAPARTSPAQAPETALNLELRGVFYTPGKTGGHAIIASAGGIERQYGIGDALPGNARLQAVLPYKVIIKRAGRLESLTLPVTHGTETAATSSQRRIPDAASVAQITPVTRRRQEAPDWTDRTDR